MNRQQFLIAAAAPLLASKAAVAAAAVRLPRAADGSKGWSTLYWKSGSTLGASGWMADNTQDGFGLICADALAAAAPMFVGVKLVEQLARDERCIPTGDYGRTVGVVTLAHQRAEGGLMFFADIDASQHERILRGALACFDVQAKCKGVSPTTLLEITTVNAVAIHFQAEQELAWS